MGTFDATFPPKPKWTAKDIPDLTGKVVIVTGGNTGIGKETVKALLEKNAKVYLAARSQARAESAIADLKKSTEKDALFLELDLGSLESVKKAADDFKSKEKWLDILINNAGVMIPPQEAVTHDGYDLQFGTNVLGHFYFTQLLLPVLFAATERHPDEKARVVNVSSRGHLGFPKINFDTLRDGPARYKLSRFNKYGQSKFGNIVFSNELARRYGDQLISSSLHPGIIDSELIRHVPTFLAKIFRPLLNLLWYPADMGAITQLYAATSQEGKEFNGKYLTAFARVSSSAPQADDPAIGKKLWEWLETQVNEQPSN